MAKIPLRVYNREIETLINRGQIDEAVGHCRHILRFYPKHIDTYRLLGKAYLEAQHYAEASDVLQRVLSAVPDDFVCQIGMSIIREDEGNLDAAIWHMERAFEVQPANAAVQSELRRLYGRRDGIEPPKIRLTRGALVRMYARGELYQQAIGEIRAALAEDPKRIDIEIILARMYYLSGSKVEATEVCSRLITKLPFCFEANRILAEILPETSRADDAKVYQQRVDSMDPYAAYISPNTPTLADVPDNIVMLERLEWNAGEAVSQKPEWARTVGIEWEEQQDTLPEWLDTTAEPLAVDETPIADDVLLPQLPEMSAATPSVEAPLETAADDAEEKIPDWMQAAGWGQSTSPETPPTENALLDDETGESSIASGDIPDWLQSMAPQAATEAAETDDSERINLLDSILPATGLASEGAEELSGIGEGLPGQSEDIPDWLGELTEDAGTLAGDTSSQQPSPWMADLETAPSSPGESLPQEALPDWMKAETLDLPTNIEALETQPADAVIEDATSIIQPVEEATATAEPQAETLADNPEDAFAWLEALATKQGAAEETLLTRPEDRTETPPDWLQQLERAEAIAEPGVEALDEVASPQETIAELAPEADSIAPGDDIPDWLKDLQKDDGEAAPGLDVSSEQAINELAATSTTDLKKQESELPDFLQDISAETLENGSITIEEIETIDQGGAPVAQIEEATLENDVPDWLKELENEPTETLSEAVEEIEAIEQVSDQPSAPAVVGLDETPDWLKELAIEKTTASDETPAMAEDQEAGQIDAAAPWIAEAIVPVSAQEAVEIAEIPTNAVSSEPPIAPTPPTNLSEMDSDSAFAWLEALAAKQGAEEETLLVKPEDRLETPPEWVKNEIETAPVDLEAASVIEVPTEATPVSTTEAEDKPVADIPDWLNSAEIETEGVKTEEIIPDWLKETVPEAQAQADASSQLPEWLQQDEQEMELPAEGPVAVVAESAAGDDAFAWLESLAAKQGADEETLLLKPEDRVEQPPEWVAEQIEPSTPTEAVEAELAEAAAEPIESVMQAAGADVPEWLKELENEVELPESLIAPMDEQALEPVETVESQAEAIETGSADVPDWLKGLESGTEEISPEAQETKVAAPVGEWLQELAEPPVEQPLGEPPLSGTIEDTHPVQIVPSQPVETEGLPQVEAGEVDAEQLLNHARAALNRGKLQEALPAYQELIHEERALDETIEDLQNALYQHPVNIDLWQTLGDAFVRSRKLQDALNTYTKAEELLR